MEKGHGRETSPGRLTRVSALITGLKSCTSLGFSFFFCDLRPGNNDHHVLFLFLAVSPVTQGQARSQVQHPNVTVSPTP